MAVWSISGVFSLLGVLIVYIWTNRKKNVDEAIKGITKNQSELIVITKLMQQSIERHEKLIEKLMSK